MKKIILYSLIVIVFISGCSRATTKGHDTDVPAKSTDTSNITANNSPDPGGVIARSDEELTEEVSVEAGASTEFAVFSGKGMMSVSIPQGALSNISQLNVTTLTGSSDGNLCPGFLCEDKANPGEHLMLSAPAVITYWQKEPFQEDAYIVSYSDDFKEI